MIVQCVGCSLGCSLTAGVGLRQLASVYADRLGYRDVLRGGDRPPLRLRLARAWRAFCE